MIDVDGSGFPNLVLMKLSAYHKAKGDVVEWHDAFADEYDIVYMSKVFSDAYTMDKPEPQNAKKVIRGGTGYAIWMENGKEVYHKEKDPPLPDEIEHIYPDYSIYPQYTGYGKKLSQQTAYGFLTRGCPMSCEFCHVAPKEGRCSVKQADLSEFWRGQGKIILSDPNILSCKDCPDLLQQLVDSKSKISLNQGVDARLITEERAELLSKMKLCQPHFAMDTMKAMNPVKDGIRRYVNAWKRNHPDEKWTWRNAKVFCLVNFDTTFEQDMQRIKAIQECECQPYVMVYDKKNAPPILRRLQRWTNSSFCYGATQDFFEYQKHTYKEILYD